MAHGVHLVPLRLEEEAVVGLLVDDGLSLGGSLGVVLGTEVERVTGHRHVDGGESGLCSLRGDVDVAAAVVAWRLVVGVGQGVLGIFEVLHDEFVDVVDTAQLCIHARSVGLGDEGQGAEYAYEVVVAVGAPVFCLPEGDVDFLLRGRRLCGAGNDEVGSFNDTVVSRPGVAHTFVVARCAEGVECGAGLLVGAGVGGDVVALPLGVHHVGPSLREVHPFVEGVDAAIEGVLRDEVVFGYLLPLRVFGQEVVT